MKIVFLNVFGGRIRDPLTRFLKEEARNTDIFCLQEVYKATKPFIRESLPGFQEVAALKPMALGDNFFGQATYVRETIPVLHSDTLLRDENDAGLGLTIHIRQGEHDIHICNFHGLTFPWGDEKLDTPTRLAQSAAIIESLKVKNGLKIVGGDFNMLPQAESIRMFEKNNYRDLIKDFHITTTRNRIALDKYPGNERLFSDYVFVSSGVSVKGFLVPDVEISDHLPLLVEIDI